MGRWGVVTSAYAVFWSLVNGGCFFCRGYLGDGRCVRVFWVSKTGFFDFRYSFSVLRTTVFYGLVSIHFVELLRTRLGSISGSPPKHPLTPLHAVNVVQTPPRRPLHSPRSLLKS